MTYYTPDKPLGKDKLRKLVESRTLDQQDTVEFNIGVSLSDLLGFEGMNGLNECLDDCVEGGYLLEDISYEPVGVDVRDGLIILKVTANADELLVEDQQFEIGEDQAEAQEA